MTQTNQNKDYSWLRRVCIDLYYKGYHEGKGDFPNKDDVEISKAQAAIQQHIDEHYIGKGEARPKQELVCELCDRGYPVWYTPNPLWNKVMRHPDGKETSEKYSFVCLDCFALEGKKLGILAKRDCWVLTTDFEVEQRCIEARIDELQKLPRVKLDKPHEHKSQKYRDYGKFLVTTYLPKRIEQLSTNNKDTLERSSNG